jgi:hypothetical protein
MKQEFEHMAETEVSDEAYDMIETVYMNYPGFNKKEQVVEMYKKHGIAIFCDLYPRSKKISETELRINSLKKELKDLQCGRT